jgi:L-arabinokinase
LPPVQYLLLCYQNFSYLGVVGEENITERSPDLNMAEPLLPADLQIFQRLLQKNLGGIFSPNRPIFIARAPGRLDVLGGVADWAGSTVLQYPLSDALIVAVQQRTDRRILIRNLNFNKERVLTAEYRLDELLEAARRNEWNALRVFHPAPDKNWASRVLAALTLMALRLPAGSRSGGVNIAIQSSLPIGAGLGSSAALLAALLLALQEAYALPLESAELAGIGRRAEMEIMQQGTGEADYWTVLHGQKDQIVAVQGLPAELKKTLALPQGVQLLAIDTGVRKAVDYQKRNELWATLWIGRTLLQAAMTNGVPAPVVIRALDDIPLEEWQRHLKKLVPYRCSGKEFLARHAKGAEGAFFIDPEKRYMPRSFLEFVIEENLRVRKFIHTLEEETGGEREEQLIALGEIFYASHQQYSKVSGLVSAEAEWLVAALAAMGPAAGMYGARVIQGGVDSAVVLLARTTAMDHLQNLLSRYASNFGVTPQTALQSSHGAKIVGVLTTQFMS